MLVHICCSVDSHYFLEKIQEEFPNEKLIGYFYDPNIHPYSEYRLRYLDVEYSCKKLGIPLIEGPYNLEEWLKKVKGMEHLPEKGDRCTVCYDDRLENSVKKAIELGESSFTTTLLISPKKSQEKLEIIGNYLENKTGIKFIFKDYRSGNGAQIQGLRVKENSLYRQNYCGCLFGLSSQREHQKKIMDEMFNPISNQILRESIEQRLELYKKRDEFEESNKEYKIIKQRFLNYRLLSGKVVVNNEPISSYIFAYSTINKNQTSSKIDYVKDGINYLVKDEVKIITIDKFNEISNSRYKSTKELIFNPLKFEDEIIVRNKILNNPFDLSALIVIDKIIDEKYEIFINSIIYEDIKEEII
ncbi:epoxyqueuosine reductase QueH [Aliarcobacter skirrowii]|uniref:epoxyqueuosine reductase QueH n=1 Tax=Aliarcobacter skirrowii TaxID=28200 RepID=UPI0029BD99B6|nr:epoxyqueuosine reductase QueH [Aliarcobacter skirrowii]MDX4067291.1 epoxyqueuosine reductase QueH [Aliarcobacter skirrowii]MDX4067331.1 epoxyqueuosine reductase QueH [Aliarcobacter skirrowii]